MATPGAINIKAADGSKLIAKESIPIWCTAYLSGGSGKDILLDPNVQLAGNSSYTYPRIYNGMQFRFIAPESGVFRSVTIRFNDASGRHSVVSPAIDVYPVGNDTPVNIPIIKDTPITLTFITSVTPNQFNASNGWFLIENYQNGASYSSICRAPLMRYFSFDNIATRWFKLFTFIRTANNYCGAGGFEFSIYQSGTQGSMRADFRVAWDYYPPYNSTSNLNNNLRVYCKNVEYYRINGTVTNNYFTTSNICDQIDLSTPGVKVEVISVSTSENSAEYAVWYGGMQGHSSTGLNYQTGVCTVTNYTAGNSSEYGLVSITLGTSDKTSSPLAISTMWTGTNGSSTVHAYITVQQPDNSVSNYTVFQNGAGNTSSDVRFKGDVVPTEDVLPVLKDLNIINYVWKKNGEPEWDTVGVSAQELEEHGGVWSKLVHKRSDADQTRFLDYDRFGVLACKAIQEQQETIETQQETIRVLEHRIEVLEKKIMGE